MTKPITLALFALPMWIISAGLSAAQETSDPSMKIVVGSKWPLANECYENARDTREDYEALDPCNQSLETESLSQRRRAGVHANRGVIYYNIGEYQLSVDDFTESLDLEINVIAKIRANRGLSFEALGYENLARADYVEALKINPDHKVASERLQELNKPLYDRSTIPRKITVEAPNVSMAGI